jgi:hypothetical protein
MSEQVVVIGSLLLIGACAAVAAIAATTYRKSKALAAAAIASEPGAPLELVCGIRFGALNASWPAGRCRLGSEGVGFSCLGFERQASWADITEVELIKPMNQIGWGVRFRIPAMKPDSTIVWLGDRRLAERLIQSCVLHNVPAAVKARAVLRVTRLVDD